MKDTAMHGPNKGVKKQCCTEMSESSCRVNEQPALIICVFIQQIVIYLFSPKATVHSNQKVSTTVPYMQHVPAPASMNRDCILRCL